MAGEQESPDVVPHKRKTTGDWIAEGILLDLRDGGDGREPNPKRRKQLEFLWEVREQAGYWACVRVARWMFVDAELPTAKTKNDDDWIMVLRPDGIREHDEELGDEDE